MALNKLFITSFPVTAVLGISLLAGCQGERAQDFSANGDPTGVGRVANAQAEKGAVGDAMLYPRDFDGNALNTLGCKKLHMIVKSTPIDQPVVVYLNMSKDASAARQGAVSQYLKDSGVKEDETQIAQGANPNMTTATAYNLSEIYKAQGPTFDGEAADSNTATATNGGSLGK